MSQKISKSHTTFPLSKKIVLTMLPILYFNLEKVRLDLEDDRFDFTSVKFAYKSDFQSVKLAVEMVYNAGAQGLPHFGLV